VGASEVALMSKLTSPFGGDPAAMSEADKKYFPAVKLLNVTE
jgi:hypothetical protein